MTVMNHTEEEEGEERCMRWMPRTRWLYCNANDEWANEDAKRENVRKDEEDLSAHHQEIQIAI